MLTSKNTHIHWFVNDLRLTDQPFLRLLEQKTHHFGVYIIDPRKQRLLKEGFRKTGMQRLQFLREHLIDLQQQYRALGSDLLVMKGYPEEVIPNIVKEYDATLSFQLEYSTEERNIQESIRNLLDDDHIFSYDGNFLLLPSYFNYVHFPTSFSGFRNKAEKILKSITPNPERPLTLPKSAGSFTTINARTFKRHEKTVFPFSGGEKAALQRLNNYLFETHAVDAYKEKRNGLLGTDYSSKLSPWLASGAISPGTILSTLKRYETNFGTNQGTYWLVFELLWRDYFRHAGKYYRDRLFYSSGINNVQKNLSNNFEAFKDWAKGRTGNKFIDANMRELALTGYMSNRGRQNVASYLVHNMNISWNLGAAWFEQNLLDYDVYSNQGNWMYIVGVGFNPKGAAVFDIDFQTERYDPTASYQNQWINENIS
jgi:deoxyribodipyrimidine photo-lyase